MSLGGTIRGNAWEVERGNGGNLAVHFFEVASEIFLKKLFRPPEDCPALHRSCGLFECPCIKPIGLLRVEWDDVIHMVAQRMDILVDGSYPVLVCPWHLGLLHRRSVGCLLDLLNDPALRCLVEVTDSLAVTLKTLPPAWGYLDGSSTLLTWFTVILFQSERQSLLAVFISSSSSSNIYKKSLD